MFLLNKSIGFFLHFSIFFVSLTIVEKKILPLGNEIKNFVFCFAFLLLIRIFAKEKLNKLI